MSTPDYDDDFLDDEPQQQQGPQQLRKALERAQAKQAESDAKAEAAERRAIFAEAGLTDLTPAQRTLLTKGYEGEMTPDAIRTFAQEAGLIAPPPPPQPDESAQAQGRIADAGATATAVPNEQAKIAELEAAAAQGPEALYAKIREHGGRVE